jgi:hypothetical protein
LTQIGPGYTLVVDAIQNDNDPVNPTIIGSCLANAEYTVRRKDAATPEGRKECFRPTKKQVSCYTIKPGGRTAGPADFQEAEDQYREGEGGDP